MYKTPQRGVSGCLALIRLAYWYQPVNSRQSIQPTATTSPASNHSPCTINTHTYLYIRLPGQA